MIKRIMVCSVLIVFTIGTFSPLQAALNQTEKKYKFILILCSFSEQVVEMLDKFSDLFDDQGFKNDMMKDAVRIDKKMKEIRKSIENKKSKLKTADESLFDEEVKQLMSLNQNSNYWTDRINQIVNKEEYRKNPETIKKLAQFSVYNNELGCKQLIKQLGMIDDPKYQEEIADLKDDLENCAPFFKGYYKRAARLGQFKTIEERRDAFDRLIDDMQPVVVLMRRASARFKEIYFVEFTVNDFKSFSFEMK